MTEIIINNEDWLDTQVQKYWAFPSSYTQERKEQEIQNIISSGAYMATEKKDGHLYMFFKDENGTSHLRSRSKGVNGWNIKTGHVPHLHPFFNSLPNNTILLGEICFDDVTKTSKDITSIMGCKEGKAIKRQEDGEKVIFYIFDVLIFDGEEYYKNGALERSVELASLAEDYADVAYIQFARALTKPQEIHEAWLKILDKGGEGIVLTQKDYPYSFNKRTARKTLKLKKELVETIDVFLTGRYTPATYEYTGKEIEEWRYWYNPITKTKHEGSLYMSAQRKNLVAVTQPWFNGWAGSVEIGVLRGGRVQPIGNISNIPNKVKEEIVTMNEEYEGRVVELQAMEIDRSGDIPTLRHAVIREWRSDKNPNDCLWEQLL